MREGLRDDIYSIVERKVVPDPSLEAHSASCREIVRNAILSLSSKQQEAINLVYFSDMTQSQAAERLREPLGTVKARIRRSVNRLNVLVHNKL